MNRINRCYLAISFLKGMSVVKSGEEIVTKLKEHSLRTHIKTSVRCAIDLGAVKYGLEFKTSMRSAKAMRENKSQLIDLLHEVIEHMEINNPNDDFFVQNRVVGEMVLKCLTLKSEMHRHEFIFQMCKLWGLCGVQRSPIVRGENLLYRFSDYVNVSVDLSGASR